MVVCLFEMFWKWNGRMFVLIFVCELIYEYKLYKCMVVLLLFRLIVVLSWVDYFLDILWKNELLIVIVCVLCGL